MPSTHPGNTLRLPHLVSLRVASSAKQTRGLFQYNRRSASFWSEARFVLDVLMRCVSVPHCRLLELMQWQTNTQRINALRVWYQTGLEPGTHRGALAGPFHPLRVAAGAEPVHTRLQAVGRKIQLNTFLPKSCVRFHPPAGLELKCISTRRQKIVALAERFSPQNNWPISEHPGKTVNVNLKLIKE